MKALVYLLLLCALCCVAREGRADDVLAKLPTLNVAALAASEQQLFVGGFDAGLFVVERSGQVRRVRHAALNQHINALVWSERERALWVGTARGLSRCELDAAPSCRRWGPSGAIHALLLRRDGSLVAGGDAGVTLIEGKSERVLGKKNAPFRSVWALAEAPDGTLFVGATNGLFWFAPSAQGTSFRRAAVVTGELPDDWVTALHHDGSALHVGTYNAGVVSLRIEHDRLTSVLRDQRAGYVNPAGIAPMASGELALLTMDGLRVGPVGSTRLVGPARDVTALLPAWDGGHWLATRHGVENIYLPSDSAPSVRQNGAPSAR